MTEDAPPEVPQVSGAELSVLRAAIEAAGSSESALAAVFADLVAAVGREAASQRWWSAFAAADATET